MLIRSNLFSRGHPLKAEARLSDQLEHHKRRALTIIKDISDLDQMTDSFLAGLIKDSLIALLTIHTDKWTKKIRTETLDGSVLPQNSFASRMALRRDPSEVIEMMGRQKQVVRISIPFSGDSVLLQYSPSTAGTTFPQGEVVGDKIQFDVVIWGSSIEDEQRLKKEIEQNLEMISTYTGRINEQVKAFNESVPAEVKAAFQNKLDELTRQYAMFDNLGIPDEEPPESEPDSPTAPPKPKRERVQARVVHITQYVEKQYVQQLNQTNNNTGDVNNAIESK